MDTDAAVDAPTAPPGPHPGERRLQERVGLRRTDWGSAGTTRDIPPVAAGFLAAQRLVAIAAEGDLGRLWASVLTGPAGFVRAADGTTVRSRVTVPPADPLHGHLAEGAPIGMLAIDPGARKRMRINGRADSEGDELVVSTDQVYANCPKYIRARTPEGRSMPDAPAPTAVRGDHLTPDQVAWIERADTFFVGTAAAPFGADASHRGGAPGFVVASPGRLTWPEYVGNSMYMTLGNLELDPRCGLVFVDWEGGHTLHLTGRAATDWDPARAAAFPEALGVVDLEIDAVVEVRDHLAVSWIGGDPWRFTPPAPDRSAG
jgi:predicted pyridoxine 5'-phosphate oxidase superfamily flavin-nucleotide-binding protein